MATADPVTLATLGGLLVLSVSILTAAALKGWNGWLQLRRLEIERARPDGGGGTTFPAARIELADLKERVRKLEAIAAGVEF